MTAKSHHIINEAAPFSCLPGLGSLSPSRASVVGGEISCLTPGLKLSNANGQSSPSVDSISIVGAGGKIFSSAVQERTQFKYRQKENMYSYFEIV